MLKRRESILFIVVTIGIIILTLLQLNQVDFIYGLGQIILYFIFLCTFIYAIYRLINDKRQTAIFEKSKSLFLGLILTGFFFLLSYLVDTDGGKKKLIVGGVDHDINFIHFQLFTDNSFKFLNSGPFGGQIYRGKYTLIDDTLYLDNDSLHYLYPTLRLVKKTDNNKTYFEPVDSLRLKDRLFVYDDYSSKK